MTPSINIGLRVQYLDLDIEGLVVPYPLSFKRVVKTVFFVVVGNFESFK